MLKGFDENGEMRNVKVTEEGAVVVSLATDESGSDSDSSSENNSIETTFAAGLKTLSSTEQTIEVDAKITEISIANYSEEANVVVGIGESEFTIGPNIAVDLPINKEVSDIVLSASAADTIIEYIIKGEESVQE